MPRLSKSLPKHCKHKAAGQAIVTLSGRDHYLGPHGTKASKLECDWRVAGQCRSLLTELNELFAVSDLIAG